MPHACVTLKFVRASKGNIMLKSGKNMSIQNQLYISLGCKVTPIFSHILIEYESRYDFMSHLAITNVLRSSCPWNLKYEFAYFDVSIFLEN